MYVDQVLVRIHRIRHKEAFVNIGECVQESAVLVLSLGVSQVQEVKFVDDSTLLALVQTRGIGSLAA